MTTPTPEPIATVVDLENYLGRPLGDAQDQGEMMLAASCADIVSYCGWPVGAQDATWVLDADGGTVLGLPTLHLRAVTQVTLLGIGAAADRVITDFAWSEAGYLHRVAYWPVGPRSVSVAVQHGYESTPAELVVVACAMASRSMASAGAGPRTSRSIGDYSETFTAANTATGSVGADQLGVMPHERNILDRYRLSNRA